MRFQHLFRCWLGLVVSLCGEAARAAVPEQIIPLAKEIGAPSFAYTGASSSASGTGSTTTSSASYSGSWGSTDAMSTLLNQSYGADAVAAAKAAGINPDTLAAFGQIESHYQNVGNATSSAKGVWQITDGTWNEYASKLGLSGADRSDPVVQAKVSSAIISDYSSSVSKATGTTATSAQVYGAYMFGTKAGSELASESDQSAPLSKYVSTKTLAANNMTGWTVGQYYQTVSSRMGSGATEKVTG